MTISPDFLQREVEFNNTLYTLLAPLTDYRACHDGHPLEARILYLCRPATSDDSAEYVVKIKVQLPSPSRSTDQPHEPGPSTTTVLERKALTLLRDAGNPHAPHFLGFTQAVQGEDCPLPGGYITYTLMNKVPGETLYDLSYWTLSEGERETISTNFLQALKSIRTLGIQHEDRALRNIMWHAPTGTCIIDFEMWKDITESVLADESKELQRWGLARDTNPPGQWWEIWFAAEKQ